MVKRITAKFRSLILNLLLFKIGGIFQTFRKPPLPKISGEPVLIHIGCGIFNDKRYINLDNRKGWHIHFQDSIENCPDIFPAAYADLIYACHVLEHVSHQKLVQTLQGLCTVLKKGGILRLSVPDFDTIVKMYLEKKIVKDIIEPLMGGQGYPSNFHYSVFSESHLKELLLKSGFTEVRRWDPTNAPYHNFDDWSRRKISLYGQEWPISLNLEAIK